ncbi:MAG: hypothetical protein HC771_03490 [Synechococcales cyanobacterium CRU_2_2]|nr:hypothetical protein [Synechococcales cyanobacterium CRU_2_2]
MKWKKLGQLYEPRPLHPKLISHAANPLPILLEGDIYRVLYSGRDRQNRSSVGYVDIDIAKQAVVYVHDQPIFEHGSEGSFYSHGVSIGNCYEVYGQCYILFMGWQCLPGEHWRGEIGRLRLETDWSLVLDAEHPLISIDSIDPISLSYPWVLKNGEGLYQMWYGSTTTWEAGNGEMIHGIYYAESKDGHQWEKKGLAVPYELNIAQAFSRPSVLQAKDGSAEMWFSYRSGRGESYRIGYALHSDSMCWQLHLACANVDISPTGWDSEMVEYPFVFEHNRQRLMLYNGDGFGKTGFGLAVLEY